MCLKVGKLHRKIVSGGGGRMKPLCCMDHF